MQRERYVCLEAATLEIPTGIAHKLRNVPGQFFLSRILSLSTDDHIRATQGLRSEFQIMGAKRWLC